MNKTFLTILGVAILVTLIRLTVSIYTDSQDRLNRYAAHETTRHADLAAEEQQRIKASQKK